MASFIVIGIIVLICMSSGIAAAILAALLITFLGGVLYLAYDTQHFWLVLQIMAVINFFCYLGFRFIRNL